jgi:small-conductance mechanosensitive channel
MTLDLTTPAILFPAVSLLLLAYTNRFLALASLIRSLSDKYRDSHDRKLQLQIRQLRHRLSLIKLMQFFGIFSLFLCVIAMLFLFLGMQLPGKILFGAALFSLTISLALTMREISISVDALEVHLSDMEKSEITKA